MAKPGPKTKFTEAQFHEICRRLAEGEPLAQICREPGMPSVWTVYDWKDADEANALRFARARDAGHDAIALEALRIADTPVEAIISKESEKGVEITKQDALGHRRLQVETRLKLLAKWDPKRYGDKLELAGDATAPLQVQIIRLSEGSK